MEKEYNKIMIILGSLIVCAFLFETVLLGISFFGADKVECNLLWCTFTTERRTIESNTIINSSKQCYEDGVSVDCSNINWDKLFEDADCFKNNTKVDCSLINLSNK
jgi:hypothetical protein